MGIKSFVQELKTTISPSRLFKALVTDSHKVLPRCTDSVKSIEFVKGNEVSEGCIIKTTFSDGVRYVTHRIDSIDYQNYVCQYTLTEGEGIGDKLEKVCNRVKFESSEGGGCVIKLHSDYHTKGDIELNEDEIKASKDLEIQKACVKYLTENPDVCA